MAVKQAQNNVRSCNAVYHRNFDLSGNILKGNLKAAILVIMFEFKIAITGKGWFGTLIFVVLNKFCIAT
jgi:hypothetical protein